MTKTTSLLMTVSTAHLLAGPGFLLFAQWLKRGYTTRTVDMLIESHSVTTIGNFPKAQGINSNSSTNLQ